MTRLTRQGVRDLDGPQRNGRRRSRAVGCLHDWQHARDCAPCDIAYGYASNYIRACEERCARCGVRR